MNHNVTRWSKSETNLSDGKEYTKVRPAQHYIIIIMAISIFTILKVYFETKWIRLLAPAWLYYIGSVARTFTVLHCTKQTFQETTPVFHQIKIFKVPWWGGRFRLSSFILQTLAPIHIKKLTGSKCMLLVDAFNNWKWRKFQAFMHLMSREESSLLKKIHWYI